MISSLESRHFLTETQTYIDRGGHLEKPRKRVREEGQERGEGTSPLKSVFDLSQFSGSTYILTSQDGGIALLLLKKKSLIVLQNTPALQARWYLTRI